MGYGSGSQLSSGLFFLWKVEDADAILCFVLIFFHLSISTGDDGGLLLAWFVLLRVWGVGSRSWGFFTYKTEA